MAGDRTSHAIKPTGEGKHLQVRSNGTIRLAKKNQSESNNLRRQSIESLDSINFPFTGASYHSTANICRDLQLNKAHRSLQGSWIAWWWCLIDGLVAGKHRTPYSGGRLAKLCWDCQWGRWVGLHQGSQRLQALCGNSKRNRIFATPFTYQPEGNQKNRFCLRSKQLFVLIF